MKNIYVQMTEAPTLIGTDCDFREGFRNLVESQWVVGDGVILFEVNGLRRVILRELWQEQVNVDIRDGDWHIAQQPEVQVQKVFSLSEEGPPLGISSADASYVERFNPGSRLVESYVQSSSLLSLLHDLSKTRTIRHLSLDLRFRQFQELDLQEWKFLNIDEVTLTIKGVEDAILKQWKRSLAAAGYIPAGRRFGAAGTAATFVKVTNFAQRLGALQDQLKVNVGRLIVNSRALCPDASDRSALRMKIKRFISPEFSIQDVLDRGYGAAFSQVDPEEVEVAIESVRVASDSEFEVLAGIGNDVEVVARQCHQHHGIWPISFSYPRTALPAIIPSLSKLSSITPGFPYSFSDEEKYLDSYGKYLLGLTHRKAGWDCFRHLEILASGAIPYMIDAGDIPKYSMVHYPKKAMVEVVELVRVSQMLPGEKSKLSFRDFFQNNLTSKSMAKYILKMSGLQDAQSVLFVDEQLPAVADYLSVLTLIGLKQLLGVRCQEAFPVDYIYRDTQMNTASLYGRGFGYTRVIESGERSLSGAWPQRDATLQSVNLSDFDAVVVGSARNATLAKLILQKFPPEKTIWIHGEDTPPTFQETKKLRMSRTNVFVRSINTSE